MGIDGFEFEGVTAVYDDAVRFVGGRTAMMEKKLRDGMKDSFEKVMADTIVFSADLNGAVETVAFVFGKTKNQVLADVRSFGLPTA